MEALVNGLMPLQLDFEVKYPAGRVKTHNTKVIARISGGYALSGSRMVGTLLCQADDGFYEVDRIAIELGSYLEEW